MLRVQIILHIRLIAYYGRSPGLHVKIEKTLSRNAPVIQCVLTTFAMQQHRQTRLHYTSSISATLSAIPTLATRRTSAVSLQRELFSWTTQKVYTVLTI